MGRSRKAKQKTTEPKSTVPNQGIPVQIDQPEDLFKKSYYIATIIIALVALTGLYWSYKSMETSNNVATTLEGLKINFESMISPVVSYKGYKWMMTKPGGISCMNPPSGIAIEYHNPSNVAVVISKVRAEYFYGDQPIDEIHQSIGGKASKMLVPKESSFITTTQSGPFNKYLSKDKNTSLNPPFFNITLEVRFSRYGDNKEYKYYTKRQFLFNCKYPNQTSVVNIEEHIEHIQ